MPVAHQLLARPGVGLNELTQVVSHPQALAQCRSFIERFLPQAAIKEAVSTAEAAALVSRTPAPWAAIGTTLVAQSHGLATLAENINDCPDNATRFIIIAPEDADKMPGCKTSLIFSVKDRPGALCDVLLEFSKREINLTRIESRPTKNKLGEYLFFIDFQGHRLEQVVQEALTAISEHVISMRVLGSYPVDGEFKSQPEKKSLPLLMQLRHEIDEIDNKIMGLLGKRTCLVKQIGELKKQKQIRDIMREEKIIHRLRSLAVEQGMDGQVVENIYRILFDYYVSLQMNKVVV